MIPPIAFRKSAAGAFIQSPGRARLMPGSLATLTVPGQPKQVVGVAATLVPWGHAPLHNWARRTLLYPPPAGQPDMQGLPALLLQNTIFADLSSSAVIVGDPHIPKRYLTWNWTVSGTQRISGEWEGATTAETLYDMRWTGTRLDYSGERTFDEYVNLNARTDIMWSSDYISQYAMDPDTGVETTSETGTERIEAPTLADVDTANNYIALGQATGIGGYAVFTGSESGATLLIRLSYRLEVSPGAFQNTDATVLYRLELSNELTFDQMLTEGWTWLDEFDLENIETNDIEWTEGASAGLTEPLDWGRQAWVTWRAASPGVPRFFGRNKDDLLGADDTLGASRQYAGLPNSFTLGKFRVVLPDAPPYNLQRRFLVARQQPDIVPSGSEWYSLGSASDDFNGQTTTTEVFGNDFIIEGRDPLNYEWGRVDFVTSLVVPMS